VNRESKLEFSGGISKESRNAGNEEELNLEPRKPGMAQGSGLRAEEFLKFVKARAPSPAREARALPNQELQRFNDVAM
jgi:hypothetical protein